MEIVEGPGSDGLHKGVFGTNLKIALKNNDGTWTEPLDIDRRKKGVNLRPLKTFDDHMCLSIRHGQRDYRDTDMEDGKKYGHGWVLLQKKVT